MQDNRVTFSELGEPFPNRPESWQILDQCSLFHGLDQSTQELFLANSHLAYADRNDVIWQEGSPSRFFIVVGNGIVRVTQQMFGRREVTIDAMGLGSFDGQHLSNSDSLYRSTATTASSLWYLKIPNLIWHHALNSDPGLYEKLFCDVVTKMRLRIDFTVGLLTGNEVQRVGLVLLRLGDQFIGPSSNVGTFIPVSLDGLSELSETSFEFTKEVILKWKDDRTISIGARGIRIDRPMQIRSQIYKDSVDRSF